MSEQHSLPVVYALFVADAMTNWDVSPEALLAEFGLTRAMLLEPQRTITVEDFNKLITRARDLTGEIGLALYLGQRMQVSLHGFVGFAAMTANNVREALIIAERFICMISTVASLKLVEGPEESQLIINIHSDLQPFREAALVGLIFGFVHMGQSVTGQELRGRADVEFAEPPYLAPIRHLLPGEVNFGQPVNKLTFSSSYLDLPLMMANPVASQLALSQCEQELERFGLDQPFVAQVKALMYDDKHGFQTLERVAERLHMSERTLKRQLAAHGVSYSDLVEEARLQMAVDLLVQEDVTLESIADTLGYSDLANFSRAFKRWTGQTPSGWRKLRRIG